MNRKPGKSMKKLTISVALSIALITPGTALGISSTLSDMADDFREGFTSGTSSLDMQARGYAAGSKVRVRYQPWQIQELQFVNVKPPSWDVGCHGFDLHLGAFSWLTVSDIEQVLSQFAEPGLWLYAAYLALMQACPQCKEVASMLQQWANAMNQSMNLSCENTANAIATAANNKDPMALKEGAVNAMSDMWWDFGGDEYERHKEEDPNELTQDAEASIDPSSERKMTGNFVWDALVEGVDIDNALVSNAVGMGNSNELRLLIMTITGAYISRYEGDGTVNHKSYSPHRPRLESLIYGDDLEVFGCASAMPTGADKFPGSSPSGGYTQTVNMCRWLLQDNVNTADSLVDRESIDVPSLFKAAYELLDPDNPDSLFYLMSVHSDSAELSDEIKAFSDNSGFPLIKLARDYALGGSLPPRQQIEAIAMMIATEQALTFVLNALDIALSAVSHIEDFQSEIHNNIVDARQHYIQEAEYYYYLSNQLIEVNQNISEDAMRNMKRRIQGRN